MIEMDKTACDEKSIKRFLEQYELPLNVRKSAWFGPFYFKIDHIDSAGRAIGKRYRGSSCYDDYSCSVHEIFCLYGQNQEKPRQDNIAILSKLIKEANNPNGLDLNMSHYIKGVTPLFVHRDNQLFSVTFDHFEEKNGKVVIYIVHNGKKSFYAFPSTTYLFPNKDDGNIAVARVNQRYKKVNTSPQIAVAAKIITAYMKLPKSHCPSKNHDEEIRCEKAYHSSVNEKLLNDLMEPQMSIESSQNDLNKANNDYRQACMEARENDGIWDENAYLSIQIRSNRAHKNIESATSKINEIESLRMKPYFARVDCGSTPNDLHTAYIGEQDIPGYVVSWRHPEIGNAYYHSATLQNRDDIVIALKRVIEIENSNFICFEDEINQYSSESSTYKDNENAVAADDLLIRLLKLSREDKSTHDIIRSIQSEQYDIITSDFKQNAVINGCAGSGKTMIMYHRLSYIAYNYETFIHKKFCPESVYVISPSVYFDLSNISLLKKLSIGSVNHAPLEKTIEMLIRRYCAEKNLATVYGLSSANDNNLSLSSQFFCSETFNNYFDEVEKIQADTKKRASYQVWTIECVNRLLSKVDLHVLPKDLDFYQKGTASNLLYSTDYYYNSCFNKNDKTDENSRDEQERRIRLKNIIANISIENIQESLIHEKKRMKDKKIKDRLSKLDRYLKSNLCSMALAVKTKYDSSGDIFIKLDGDGFWSLFDKPSVFNKMLTLVLVEKILNSVFPSAAPKEGDYLLRCVYVGEKQFSAEHLANGDCLLYYLAALTKKYGAIIQGTSFLFIDEFQNYSPFELRCIRDAFEEPIVNLYGDFDQRIEEKGVTLQTELQSIIEPTYYNINVNYRNARQITNYINQAVHKNMYSIGIDGYVSEVSLQECQFQVNNRTAIIAKDIRLAKKALINVETEFLNDLTVSGEIQKGKFTLVSVLDCRGLEFDTVYVLDYGMTENEKYVAYTRALDNLVVIHDSLTTSCPQLVEVPTTKPQNVDTIVAEKQLSKQFENAIESRHVEKEIVPEKQEIPMEVRQDKVRSIVNIINNYLARIDTINTSDSSKNSLDNRSTEKSLHDEPSESFENIEKQCTCTVKTTSEEQISTEDIIVKQPSVSVEIGSETLTPIERKEGIEADNAYINPLGELEGTSTETHNKNHEINGTICEDSSPAAPWLMPPFSNAEKDRIEEAFKDSVYYDAISKYNSTDLRELEYALHLLESIADWRDVSAKILAFRSKIGIITLEIEKSQQKMAEYRSRNVCQYCGGSFRGLLTKTCSKCGRKKDY